MLKLRMIGGLAPLPPPPLAEPMDPALVDLAPKEVKFRYG